MDHYLIESRLFGKVRQELKQLILEVDETFELGYRSKRRPVPHITLAGPFTTNREDRLVYDFKQICEGASIMRLKFNGFQSFDDMRVVYLNAFPSIKLQEFRRELLKRISPYCILSSYDQKSKFIFHATISMKIPHDKYDAIKTFVFNHSFSSHHYYLTRITLLKNTKILNEYDLILHQLMNREEALNKRITAMTVDLLIKRIFKR